MNALIAIFLFLGSFMIVVASFGIVKMPDIYTRMHVATKAGTVGIGFILLAVAFYFSDLAVTSLVVGTLLFVGLTAPVAAHILGKAMMESGYQFWKPGGAESTSSEPDNDDDQGSTTKDDDPTL